VFSGNKIKFKITEKVFMKRFLIIFAILFSVLSIFSQQPSDAAAVPDSASVTADSASVAEPVIVLSDEEKLCKQAADDFMEIYNGWDVTRDYNILLPRITAYADNYYKTGTEPNESNLKDLKILKENYENLLGLEISETLMNLLSIDLERVNAELEGNQQNPALIGYLEKIDFDRIKALDEFLVKENKTNSSITSYVETLRPVFKNIRRYSIGFDEMLTAVYNEITRVTDKRVYFLYIEDDVKNKLQEISVRLADEVNKKIPEYKKKITDDIDSAYVRKQRAEKQLEDFNKGKSKFKNNSDDFNLEYNILKGIGVSDDDIIKEFQDNFNVGRISEKEIAEYTLKEVESRKYASKIAQDLNKDLINLLTSSGIKEQSDFIEGLNTIFEGYKNQVGNDSEVLVQTLGKVIENLDFENLLFFKANRRINRDVLRVSNEDIFTFKQDLFNLGAKHLEDQKKYLYAKWIEARKVNIDKLKSAEVSRLTGVISGFMTSPGQYDVNRTLINKLQQKSPDLEEYVRNLLRAKFYNDLNSKFKVYFRFEVENGFRKFRINIFIASLFFFGLFFYVFSTVKKKRDSIYIRRIPGLDAIDDAVGRATEMGKPIIYDSGLGGFSSPQTIASMLILRSVAKKVAEFKAEIIYPAYDPVVLQVAEEMIASGFLDAGYPEDHKKDNCFFMVQDQFAFAAGLSGLIARKKPATALHFGYYAAESLLISEAGFAAGAIQVAGTTEATQLPFFITSCDYTLIGEELYAAAAYLSRDAQVLSNLKLSDYGKVIFGALFVLGTVLLTINSDWTFFSDLLSTY